MCAGGVLVVVCVIACAGVEAAERPVVAPGADVPTKLDDARCATQLPANVRVSPDLVPRIQVMLERSHTFRRQCQRLAEAPWVHVAVRIDPHVNDNRGFRAVSVIQRPQPRMFVAVVTVQALADPAIWLAHEFEHLLEQMEDLDLDTLAEKRRAVWRVNRDMFETARAIRAGETVFTEVLGKSREDNFVD